ncbi:DNA-binding response OmpR family regulator [Desulfosalsimonas propionicica]|uniref:DNA-binding response OmpR family regulator n=1 Tax=Desulfosalsimonas propionicica TaxID=332175 RepID=A0A7W0CA61_9BACT|nr:response regulator [Desulfosalsimonas propionicica]MBA2881996.1 DNA-binding response OmpR family regulator [Desulfosalsimonas propionicica]
MTDSIKVLLVDDEEEFVTTLAERLEMRGFDPSIATSGDQALSMVQDKAFDLIVLDLMMPGIGGLEVMKQIKSANPDMPIILLTGQGSTKEGMEGMNQGAFDFLMKPLDIEELISQIHEALGKTSA